MGFDRVPGAAFAPIAVCAVLIAALAPGLPIAKSGKAIADVSVPPAAR